jgi:hypothetical protein
VARPKALGRIVGLPYDAHSYFLPIISESLPTMDEICKRSARFVGSNALFCCQRYGFDLELFRLYSQVFY